VLIEETTKRNYNIVACAPISIDIPNDATKQQKETTTSESAQCVWALAI
jgi:hypothetical protein